MKHEQSGSLWTDVLDVPSLLALGEDQHADVCIVGAGIAGLTTAYLLAQQGKSVIVLEAELIGGGQTGRTTAHLSNAIDDHYVTVEKLHGEPAAQLAAQSHSAAIARIESIVQAEHIACDFERLDGYLFAPPGDVSDLLDRELKAAHRASLTEVRRVERAPWPDFDTGPCLCFPQQAQFHPMKYLAALAHAILRAGGRIFTHTRVRSVEGGPPARVETKTEHHVTAEAVVVATNTPSNDRLVIHTKQAAYRTYALAARLPRNSVTRALYWDTLDPYHYVRLATVHGQANPEEVLIVGGEDHKTGQETHPEQCHLRLEEWARERFPNLGAVVAKWSGQVMEPVDGLAFIGRNPGDTGNVFIATGDSGMGMTHGTIAGILLTDLILGRKNAWEELYAPSRKTVRSVGEYLKENLNIAVQYTDWLKSSDVASEAEISRGSGAVIRRGLTKAAVYRDEQGHLHECSAVCPHLGAMVRWNAAEQTWDCPAHGSRFDCHGQVIQGPANGDLAVTSKEKAEAVS